ncbi:MULTISPECIES: methyltransferase domain-containing protein [Streptomyces]|uniref:Methyltransferase domain-containing protein n=2 Tax=Streptomyces TaxID=1883 RepID=A0ABV9IS77_9ACTN
MTNAYSSLLERLDAADRLPGTAQLRALSYDLLGVTAGSSVVDVGCGGGRAVAELSERGVRAIGVDASERMIAAARERWPGADLRHGDAYTLPLPDASVDGWRADKVLHELAEPERALTEARRVLVPGGRILPVGQDWDMPVVDSDDPALTRALVHARADRVISPRAARAYRALLLDAGFDDVTVEVRTTVLTGPAALPLLTGLTDGVRTIPEDRKAAWLTEQREQASADRFFLALPMFVASATAALGACAPGPRRPSSRDVREL